MVVAFFSWSAPALIVRVSDTLHESIATVRSVEAKAMTLPAAEVACCDPLTIRATRITPSTCGAWVGGQALCPVSERASDSAPRVGSRASRAQRVCAVCAWARPPCWEVCKAG